MSLREIVRLVFSVLALFSWTLGASSAAYAAEDEIDYNRDVRSILSDKCFKCHGPDSNERQAGLRLDDPTSALAEADSGLIAIVPAEPDESELIRRIYSTDEGEVMPPPDSGKSLSDAERETLRRWIEQGAQYDQLWSFVVPQRPELAAVQNAAWVRNGIDYYVLAQLEAAGLQPSPEADRATLIRRLTLDLTGLPPTPKEVDDFLNDPSPDAYEKVVDRLLASVHFGERMALEWLDAARFADTHGFHIDSGRDMTLWREWVINAFNQNLPFDRFTIDQLAGDMLPNATLEQKIASGFNRNHMINFEGGAIPQEYHNTYIVDRVNTTGAVWLGLTVACAQCHDHKYDPITQKEYYQFYAFFHNVPENGLDGSKGNAAPLLRVPSPQQQQQLDELDAAVSAVEQRLVGTWPEVDQEQAQWEARWLATNGSAQWEPLQPTELRSTGGATLTRLDDGSVLASGPNADKDVFEIVAETQRTGITAVQLEALLHESLPGGGPGRYGNSNFVLTGLELDAISLQDNSQVQRISWQQARADYSQRDFEIAKAIDGDAASGWAVDGPTRREAAKAVLVPTAPFGFEGGTRLQFRLKFESPYAGHAIGRARLSVSSDLAAAVEVPEDIRQILALPADQRTSDQQASLLKHYREHYSVAARQLREELAALRTRRQELESKIPSTMVMQEMMQPRETFVLVRGAYDKPGERVSPGVPASLPPLPSSQPADRLALAKWFVSPDQPLTARVIVNRYWQMCFGTGLVKTSEDFGSQGELPSHPELLDWLAVEFREPSPAPVGSGSKMPWDIKAIIRLIVTSSTYRQSSIVTPELLAMDPENRLLARGPRFRLHAEFIRDQALAISGLLDKRIGGYSVSPYQPPGLWEELASREDGDNWTAQKYTQSEGADLYRRTMYTFWKRTSPPPTLSTFDAPDREFCTLRRARTNTPLQALVLMNDPTYVEASRKLAERILREGGDTTESRLAFAFRLATARAPSEREIQVLSDLYAKELASFQANEQSAAKLLAVGASPCASQWNAAELAAWTMVANAILNLDETITKG